MITIKAFGDEIALSHYAFSFIIYYATGCNFRQRVHQLFHSLFYKLGCRCDAFMKLGVNDESENNMPPSIARRSHNRLLLTNSDRQDDAQDVTLRTSYSHHHHHHHPQQQHHHRQSQKFCDNKKSLTDIDSSLESTKENLFKSPSVRQQRHFNETNTKSPSISTKEINDS
ncbi:unnamed protein product [Schistosoma turkestanicum]|nr:unnamed protein product [Schistosoma turkestanicum]